LFISIHILLVSTFPGSAETDVGWGKELNSHILASCVRNICTKTWIG